KTHRMIDGEKIDFLLTKLASAMDRFVDKVCKEVVTETLIQVLNAKIEQLTIANADYERQLAQARQPVEQTREEKAKLALADHMLELVRASTEDNIIALTAAKNEFMKWSHEMTERVAELEAQFRI